MMMARDDAMIEDDFQFDMPVELNRMNEEREVSRRRE